MLKRKTVTVNARNRVVKYRKPSPSFKRSMDRVADGVLTYCNELWRGEASMLDTAVRDVLADGIAHLLHAAYDCRACGLGLNGEEFSGFIRSSMEEWFRSRGFAEWYCQGASSLFNTSRARILEDWILGTPKRRVRRTRTN